MARDSDEWVRGAAASALKWRGEEPTPVPDVDDEDYEDPYEFPYAGGVDLASDAVLTPERRAELAESDDVRVRIAISLRPELDDEERLAVRDTVRPERHTIPRWIRRSYRDPDAMRRIAASAHPLMRRSAATAPHLPPDVVAALACDDDFFVRLTLAQRCDDAPPGLIVDMHADWNGALWPGLRFRPGYPWHEVERLAAHPRPRARWTAATSPYLTPEVAVRLAEDEDASVRGEAMSSHALPVDVLMAYLPERPRQVAASPNLPWHVMHALLDEAGVPEFVPPARRA